MSKPDFFLLLSRQSGQFGIPHDHEPDGCLKICVHQCFRLETGFSLPILTRWMRFTFGLHLGYPGPAISNRGWCTCFRGKILGSFRFSDALTGSCHGSRDDYFRDAVCTYGHNTMGCSLARREGSDEWTLHVVQRELTVMSLYPGCGQGSGG